MSDLIDRQAAIIQLSHNKNKGDDEWELAVESDIQTIWKLPSAQPDIIRCKDCKQFRRWIDTDICFCDITEAEMSDNDFCSRAVRKEDG